MQTATTERQHPTTDDPRISAIDRSRVIRRMMKDHEMDEAHATATFEETLRFLEKCAAHPGQKLAPTKEVDKGWHTFLLYSKAYRTFCKHVGSGRFLDHEPNDLGHCGLECVDAAACDVGCQCRADEVRAKADCVPDPCTCDGTDSCHNDD